MNAVWKYVKCIEVTEIFLISFIFACIIHCGSKSCQIKSMRFNGQFPLQQCIMGVRDHFQTIRRAIFCDQAMCFVPCEQSQFSSPTRKIDSWYSCFSYSCNNIAVFVFCFVQEFGRSNRFKPVFDVRGSFYTVNRLLKCEPTILLQLGNSMEANSLFSTCARNIGSARRVCASISCSIINSL